MWFHRKTFTLAKIFMYNILILILKLKEKERLNTLIITKINIISVIKIFIS